MGCRDAGDGTVPTDTRHSSGETDTMVVRSVAIQSVCKANDSDDGEAL